MNVETQLRISDIFAQLADECRDGKITVGDILEKMGTHGHAFIVIFFALPFLLPIYIPGVSTIFGVIIALSGISIAFDKGILVPTAISKRDLPANFLLKLFQSAGQFFQKCEHFIKPRYNILFKMKGFKLIIGLLIFISGFILFLPLPPGTNLPPALVSMMFAIGLLQNDGIALIIAFILFFVMNLIGIFLFSSIAGYLEALLNYVLNYLK